VFKMRKQGATAIQTFTGERSGSATFVHRWRAAEAGTYLVRLEMQAMGQQAVAEGAFLIRASLMDGDSNIPDPDPGFIQWVDSDGTPWLLDGLPIVQPT
jgi:hypothetical protein